MSSSGYTPLPSDPPPAYAAGTTNSAFAGGYTDDHNKDASHPAVPPAMPPYQGSYQSGAPYNIYPAGPAVPAPGQGPYIHVYQTTPSVVIIGGCPACRVGVLEDEYSCLGIFCAIAFFPLGLLCCLAMKQRVCPNCGAVFG